MTAFFLTLIMLSYFLVIKYSGRSFKRLRLSTATFFSIGMYGTPDG
jgi:hypothetical protein